MTPDTQALIDLLPPGTPERRLEAFLALEAVIAYMLRSPGEYVTIDLSDAPRVAIVSRIPLLAVRAAIVRLERL